MIFQKKLNFRPGLSVFWSVLVFCTFLEHHVGAQTEELSEENIDEYSEFVYSIDDEFVRSSPDQSKNSDVFLFNFTNPSGEFEMTDRFGAPDLKCVSEKGLFRILFESCFRKKWNFITKPSISVNFRYHTFHDPLTSQETSSKSARTNRSINAQRAGTTSTTVAICSKSNKLSTIPPSHNAKQRTPNW